MSYNLKKLSLAGLGEFFEQSNNTDMFTVAIERFYNNIDLSKMRPTLLMEFASGYKDKFMLYSNTFDDYIIVSRKVTKAMQREAGVVKCQISFESGGDIATSDIFEIEVNPAIHDKTEDENPYVPTIVADLNDSLEALNQTVDEQITKEAEDISTLEAALNVQVEKEAEDYNDLDYRLCDIEQELSSVTKTITCNHKLEVTGQTGHEYGVAIDDQQVLIKKICGKTRRCSPNLIDGRSLSIQGSSAQVNLINNNGEGGFSIHNKTTTEIVKMYWRKYLPKGVYSFCLNNTIASFGSKVYAYDGKNTIPICDDRKKYATAENIEFPNGAEYICYELKAGWRGFFNFKPMLVKGPRIEPQSFIKYDDKLICSSADFLSVGRNYYQSEFENIFVIPNTTYHVNESAEIMYFDSAYAYIGSETVNQSFTTPSRARYVMARNASGNFMLSYGNEALPYEPYKKDVMACGIELGEWDYIEENRLVRQTSNAVVIDGSSKKVTQIDGKCLTFNVNCDNIEPYEVIANNFPTATDSQNTDTASEGFFIDNGVLKLKVDSALSVDEWNDFFRKFPETLVYKMIYPIIKDTEILPGYFVWKNGMQIQVTKNNCLCYTVDKTYIFSTKAQILANLEVDSKQQTVLSTIKQQLDAEYVKLNNVQANSFSSSTDESSGLIMNEEEINLNIYNGLRACFTSDRIGLYTADSYNDDIEVLYADKNYTGLYGPASGEIFINENGMTLYSEGRIDINAEEKVFLNGLNVIEEITTLKDKVTALETKNTSLETTATALQTKVTSLEERIASLEAAISGSETP